MQSVAFVIKKGKGKTVTHPFSNYTVVMFVQGYVTVFLRLCDSGRKERHKVATRNCAPQGMGRARHIPPQTDTVVMFVQGDVTVFLRLCDLGSKERHKVATRNRVPQVEGRYLQTCAFLSLR